VKKYIAFSQIAFQQELAARGAVIGRFLFYGIVLMIFSHLWTAVQEQSGLTHEQSVDMIWYLALTEWIVLSVPLVYSDVEKDVKSGDIAYFLCRPVSYLNMKLFEAFGMLTLRMLVLGVAGVFFARIFSGDFPTHPTGLLFAAPLCYLAGLLATAIYTAIGFSAFWLQEATPVYWVWQKASFIFGGLIFPLSIYPEWLRKISLLTPFSFFLYRPAHCVVEADPEGALRTLVGQIFWGFVAAAVLKTLYSRGQRILQVNGG
jgi:ABC-2 type transport system permease protein